MMTPPKDRKWQVFVNQLFMSGHYTYHGARKAAESFTSGRVEIRMVINLKQAVR